ncbi:hypothetical protein E2562_032307 [Oryza meyeriana var. granulata]|uniref:Uncharacterized protein n=1 Tax=Oryza meyeriana var. granulata TaxID=110450 RepID=A0A6G1ERT4_9ORYZ|nr:hypothetical protein E2562_032307 [Oryza meyeriana var. granulata]
MERRVSLWLTMGMAYGEIWREVVDWDHTCRCMVDYGARVHLAVSGFRWTYCTEGKDREREWEG